MKAEYYPPKGRVLLAGLAISCMLLGSGAFSYYFYDKDITNQQIRNKLYNEIENAERTIETLKNEKLEDELAITRLTKERDDQKRTLAQLQQEKENLSAQLTKAHTQIAISRNACQVLKQKLSTTKQQLAQLQQLHEQLRQTHARFQKQQQRAQQQLRQKLQATQQTLEALRSTYQTTTQQLTKAQVSIAAFRKENSELIHKLTAVSKSLGELKEKHLQTQEDLEQALSLKKGYDQSLNRLVASLSLPETPANEDDVQRLKASACYALGIFRYEPAMPLLIKMLAHKNFVVRYCAALALGQFGPQASQAVGPLQKLLLDSNKRVVAQAARSLGEIGNAARSAISALIRTLDDIDPQVRQAASVALGKIGAAAVPELTAVLKEDNRRVRYHAIEALGYIGPAAAATIPLLVPFLQDEGGMSDLAEVTCQTLGKMGQFAVPALQQVLQREDPDGRNRRVKLLAIKALAMIGKPAAPAAELLTKAMSDKALRGAATKALAMIGPPAITALIKVLNCPQEDVCQAACQALSMIGQPTIPYLLKALQYESDRVQIHVIKTFANMALPAPKVLPILVDLLKSAQDLQKMRTICATMATMGKPGLLALAKSLKDRNQYVRYSAAEAIEQLGPRAKPIAASIRRAYTDNFWSVRYLVAKCLGKMRDKRACYVLNKLLKDRQPQVRQAAAQALKQIEAAQAKD